MENMIKCPGCSKHCDRNNLQCGKGEAIYNGNTNPDSQHCHSHREGTCCGRHEGKKHGHCGGMLHGLFSKKHHGHNHRPPEFPAGSLADLMAQCGHRLFHGGDESMFAVLTDEESATLKKLLTKLISS